ncbi:50S ribosome-binding GTPase [Ceratobasidium sp. AG-Ba]|nr:50S ribosome-binding GTPase [Ceratobasidium sp. AG-Ba]
MPPVLVVVFGPTGSGKTSFVNAVTGSHSPVGYGLESCTREVTTEGIPTISIDGTQVQLIDTPGFDDSQGSDIEILKAISSFLVKTFQQGQLVTGLIYMHRITDPRLGGSGRRNLQLFRRLCGQDSLRNVMFLASMWGVLDYEQELSNERELLAHPLVSDFGCQSARLVDRSSLEGRRIVGQCILASPQVLAIQKEMAQEGARLEQTTAYEVLDEEFAAQKRQHEQEVEQLRRAAYKLREQSNTLNKRRAVAEAEEARLAQEYAQAEEARRRAEEQRIAIEHRRIEIEKEMAESRQRNSSGRRGFLKTLACGLAVGLML